MAVNATPLERKIRQLLGGPQYPKGGPLHIVVMLVLVSYGQDGQDMRPSGATLATETSLSRRQITRVLNDLEAWHFIKAVEREDRRPVVWAIGDALTGENRDHVAALREKAKFIAEHEVPKPKPDPNKTEARTVKAVIKHLSGTPLMRRDDNLRSAVLVISDATVDAADKVLDGELPAIPTPSIGPDAVEAKPQYAYASFAAKHTREDEAEAA